MKREKKVKKRESTLPTTKQSASAITPPKTLAERLGISPEVLLGEPKITVTGDYQVEIVNHKGIISLSCEQIEVNTRKYVYKILGSGLVITALTDDEITVSGNLVSIEKL
ncbi:MAG: YabP/YqfC family sporulation protein [Clostridia bacterium]|nr:YabP/YqfC family sporulation protein [Clostridia bacterium]